MAARYEFPILTNIGNVAAPSGPLDVANKAYVDQGAGGVRNLYQLDDVDINESGTRTQITFSINNPIDEVQPNLINIQPNIAVTGLAVGDYISPTATFPEVVQITNISPGGLSSTNITVSGNATIWIGTGTFDQPQYQTIFKAVPTINDGDVVTWRASESKWVNLPGGAGVAPLIETANTYTADNTALNIKVSTLAPSITGLAGSFGTVADYSGCTITSTPWPPTIPLGFNSQFLGIADSTNRSWAGFGFITQQGLTNITWIKQPLANTSFTNAGGWFVGNTISQLYIGNTVPQAVSGSVALVTFPDLTLTSIPGGDTFGGPATQITASPLITQLIGNSQTPPNGIALTNSGGQAQSFNNGTGVLVIPQASQAAVVAALLALGNGIVQNTAGSWILPPSYSIWVGLSANPLATQFTRLTSITQNSASNILQITLFNNGNFVFFGNVTYPQTLFFGLNRFTFASEPQTEIIRLIANNPGAQNFAYRDDVVYECVDNNNIGFFGVPRQGQQATGTITFASAVPANTVVTSATITFTSTVPAAFIDGTPILVFSTGLFNISVAILDVIAGTPATYLVSGQVNAAPNTSIPAASYTIIVYQAIPVQTSQGLYGPVRYTSSDGSVAIATNTANNSIDLRATATGGGGGGVLGTNNGDFINANILEFIGANGDEAYAQVGSGSGVSTNSSVIDPGVGSDGWRFNGGQTRSLIQNVVAQLGAQRQRWRLTFSGTWNIQTWGAYPGVGSYQQYILRHPVFARNNFAWEDDLENGMFPGFRPDPNVPGPSWQYLLPLTPVTYIPNRTNASGIRWSPNSGYLPTQGQAGQLTTYLNSSGIACVNVPIGQSVSYTGGGPVTVPLKFAGSNRYVGAEWIVDVSGTGNSIPVRLAEGIGAGINIDQDLWPSAADRNLILWNVGQPSATALTNAILEINVETNNWSADSTVSWPTGFPYTNATLAAARYNFTFTTEDPPGVSYSAIDYQMWNQNEDSPLSPLAQASWRNQISVTLGGATAVPSLQQVTNVSNAITNTSPNVGSIVATDTSFTPSRSSTFAGAGIFTPSLSLNGTTSGVIGISAGASPISYSLTLPSAQSPANNSVPLVSTTGVITFGYPLAFQTFSNWSATAAVVAVAGVVGASQVVVGGNQTALFPSGTPFSFSSTGAIRLFSSGTPTFDGTNTTITLLRQLATAVNVGFTLFTPTIDSTGRFNQIAVGNNLVGQVVGGILSLDSTGGGGSNQTLQQVLNTGNTATNASGNTNSITLTDSTLTPVKSTVLRGNGIDTINLNLVGFVSLNQTRVFAHQNNSTYNLFFPQNQATASGQTLLNDGNGNLTWGSSTGSVGLATFSNWVFSQLTVTNSVIPNVSQITVVGDARTILAPGTVFSFDLNPIPIGGVRFVSTNVTYDNTNSVVSIQPRCLFGLATGAAVYIPTVSTATQFNAINVGYNLLSSVFNNTLNIAVDTTAFDLQDILNNGATVDNAGNNTGTITLQNLSTNRNTILSGNSVDTYNLILRGRLSTNQLGIFANQNTSAYNVTYPPAQGTSGQTLINDGSGNLTWGSPSAPVRWSDFTTNARYISPQTPTTGVSVTFTTPATTVTGTVSTYNRFTSAGVPTTIYRFVPTVDSDTSLLGLDSWWTTFSGGVLSGLITQRGII